MLKSLVVGFLLFLSTTVLGQDEASGLAASNGWFREVLPGQKSLAIYVSLLNSGPTTLTIESVEVVGVAHSMLHMSYDEKGLSRMKHLDSLVLESGQSYQLQPGATHIMTMGLPNDLQQRRALTVILRTSDGQSLSFEATMKAI